VEYLLSLGRRHVGLIAGPLEWLEARQRKQGWEDALKNAGIVVSPEKWSQGNWSSASGEAAFAELAQKYPTMNAVFVSNDQMALGVLHYAHARGLHVPDDLAVIGFDNLTESAYFTPGLTTINQPLRELGSLAVKSLLAQIEGSGVGLIAQAMTLNTDLVIRESTPSA
jgi:LacI family transcriptional regulator